MYIGLYQKKPVTYQVYQWDGTMGSATELQKILGIELIQVGCFSTEKPWMMVWIEGTNLWAYLDVEDYLVRTEKGVSVYTREAFKKEFVQIKTIQ